MGFSDDLLAAGEGIWDAQYGHPFVVELAEGTLAPAAFRRWLEQDYRYLLDYARTFAVAGARAREEETMRRLLGVAHETIDVEMDLHREFAAEYGLTPADLEAVEKRPTCEAYTSFLLRTAHAGSLAETAAAVYPCGRGYLDVADHVADRVDDGNPYAEWVETYTSDAFREEVAWLREWVDDCAERYPGERDAMREAFLTSARLEAAFWGMAYEGETWPDGSPDGTDADDHA
jgi:thiaminase/transcriptional activator TenA